MPTYIGPLAIAVLIAMLLLLLLVLRRRARRPTRGTDAWQRWRGCTRKRVYATKREAQVIVGRHAQQGDTVDAYQCRWCGRWHVGHSSR